MGMMPARNKKKKPGTLTAPGRYGAPPSTFGGGYAPYKPIGLPPGLSHGIR